MDEIETKLRELERAVGFNPKTPCIYCEQPVGALSMGGPLICPACDCGQYRQDYPIERLRGRRWSEGHDWTKFYANARRRMAALQKTTAEQ